MKRPNRGFVKDATNWLTKELTEKEIDPELHLLIQKYMKNIIS